jgi:hypothetical protein
MDLTPGTSRKNVLSMYMLGFGLYLYLYTKTGAMGYLLQADYGVSLEDSGKVTGKLNSYAEMILLCG